MNGFPEGLLKPIGNSQGRSTDTGLAVSTVYLGRPLPYSPQYSFGVQRELPGGWIAEAAYSANYSRRLPVSASVNVLPVSELGKEITYYTTRVPNPMAGLIPNSATLNAATIQRQLLLLPYPHYGGITLGSVPIGKQDYHSMQSRLTKRFSAGVSMLVTYTVSKNLEQVNFLNTQDFNFKDPTSLPSRAPGPLVPGRWDDGSVCGRVANANTRHAIGTSVTVRTLPACGKCIVGKLPNVNKRGGVVRSTARPMPRLNVSVARTVVRKSRWASRVPRQRAWSRSESILGIFVTALAVTSRAGLPSERRRGIAGTPAGTRCVAYGTEKASGYGVGEVGRTPGAESTVRESGRLAAA